MNNQAAQTMPSWVQERELIRATLCKELDTDIESDERTYTIAVRAANALHWRQVEIDRLKAQVAALSQTAGVVDAIKKLPRFGLKYHKGLGANTITSEYFGPYLIREDVLRVLSAAPAASGGDPPSAASVSERARELEQAQRLAVSLWERNYKESSPDWKVDETLTGVLLQISNMVSGMSLRSNADNRFADLVVSLRDRARWGRGGQFTSPHDSEGTSRLLDMAADAIEQALTQPLEISGDQVVLVGYKDAAGEDCSAFLTASRIGQLLALTQQRVAEDGRSTSYSREALEIQGARWRALCRTIDHLSPGWDSGIVGAVDAAGAAARVLTAQATTPQPSADAVREDDNG